MFVTLPVGRDHAGVSVPAVRSRLRSVNILKILERIIYMCLYPKLIRNKRYMPTKKNGYTPPACDDNRKLYVPIGCGNCIECRQQKAREWQVRLTEELKASDKAIFVTFSFSCESLEEIIKKTNNNLCNATATEAVRKFLERYRKKFGHSIKHWLITELGHTNTERLHIHGILFVPKSDNLTTDELQQLWKYGNIYVGEYCTLRTINYVVKYMLKIDQDHQDYKDIILCSAGLGANYVTPASKKWHNIGEKKDYYILPTGQKINLPIYFRNKLFTEDERENLWTKRLDEATRYVRGIKIENIDTQEGWEQYERVLKEQQKTNELLGYGDDSNKWRLRDYNITAKMLQKHQNVCSKSQKNVS